MALRNENLFDGPINNFYGFLESDEYGRFRDHQFRTHSDQTPSLIDIIEVWVSDGDATRICGSYEVFLVAVLGITELWTLDNTLEGLGWWGDNKKPRPIPNFACPDAKEYKNRVFENPVLNRTGWDVIANRHRWHGEIDLLRKIEELHSHASSSSVPSG